MAKKAARPQLPVTRPAERSAHQNLGFCDNTVRVALVELDEAHSWLEQVADHLEHLDGTGALRPDARDWWPRWLWAVRLASDVAAVRSRVQDFADRLAEELAQLPPEERDDESKEIL